MHAVELGYSYGSKKMAMGPTFFNLRIVCECLGRALRRHLEFSFGVFWFLDDRAQARAITRGQGEGEAVHDSAKTQFSYKFEDALKLNQEVNEIEDSFDRDIDEVDLQVAVAKDIEEEAKVEKMRKEEIMKLQDDVEGVA